MHSPRGRHPAGVLRVWARRRRGWPRYVPPLPSLRQPLPDKSRRKPAEPCPQHKTPIDSAAQDGAQGQPTGAKSQGKLSSDGERAFPRKARAALS